MNEIEALAAVDKALSSIKDDEARERVLDWALAKFGGVRGQRARDTAVMTIAEKSPGVVPRKLGDEHEIPGIALISDSGAFKLTVRDPKAKSTNDAAIRLALVSIHSYKQLTGDSSVSSRKIVVPVLTSWRAYTGNTRASLANHQGIIRNGDALSLDEHAKREAEDYIREILDDSIEGSWQPAGTSLKRRGTIRTKAIERKEE